MTTFTIILYACDCCTSFKCSCTQLNQLGSNPVVYKHANLGVIKYKPMSSVEMIFNYKCLEYKNPGVLYRFAMVIS